MAPAHLSRTASHASAPNSSKAPATPPITAPTMTPVAVEDPAGSAGKEDRMAGGGLEVPAAILPLYQEGGSVGGGKRGAMIVDDDALSTSCCAHATMPLTLMHAGEMI